jgi:cytosine/adenosine deaminase-related metal-dependent hydrolase
VIGARGLALPLVVLAWLVACGSSSSSGGDGPGDGGTGGDGGVTSDDEGEDAADDAAPPPPEDPPTIIPGAKDRFLLLGTIVTPDTIVEGQVLVEGDKITCVEAGTGCSGGGAPGATVIDTHGIIAPGLIDMHNHILFDIFDDDDWKPEKLYTNHDDWTNEPRYQAMVDVKQCLVNDSQGKPAWCAQTPYGTTAGSLRCEIDKYGELKGLIAGTTSIVGLPGISSACFSSLARSIDVGQNGIGSDAVQTSAIFPPSKASADAVCGNFADGSTKAYLIHCGEGTDDVARAEFPKMGTLTTTPGCLYAPQTVVTHGIALGAADITTMANAGMKLVWSPRSNVSLYGATNDLPAFLDAGISVSLGADWSMGGSQNLLDELRFAKGWSDAHFGARLTTKDLVHMATVNAAKQLAQDTLIGTLAPGMLADLAVYGGDRTKPYDAIVAARPADVRLVMVGGVPLYGHKVLEPAAPDAPGCETIDVCGRSKFLCVATTSTATKLDQTLATIKGAIDKALSDADALTPADGWSFAPITPLVKCN